MSERSSVMAAADMSFFKGPGLVVAHDLAENKFEQSLQNRMGEQSKWMRKLETQAGAR